MGQVEEIRRAVIDLSTLELEAETDVESAVLQIDLDALIRDPVA